MNKRIRKKYLTEDEKVVLKLYKECDKAEFLQFKDKSIHDALRFTDKLDISRAYEHDGTSWVSSEKGKIKATSFVE